MNLSCLAAPLSRRSPYLRRVGAWLQERFPPLGHGLLILSYTSANFLLARVLAAPERPLALDGSFGLAAIMVLGVLFHLRVFDEHKDYAEDCRHHPGRVLQRGIVTLKELRVLGGAALAVELVAGLLGGPAALAGVVLVQAFTLLMLVEFFCPGWLRRHFLVYAVSHLLVMPLLALGVFSLATGRWFFQAPGWFWVYAFVGFFVTFNWEVSRKIRAPEQEIAGVDSYTSVLGTGRAAWLVLVLRLVDTALVALVGHRIGLGWPFQAALVALFLVCGVSFLRFRLAPRPDTARAMERWAGLYIVAFDLLLVLELHRRGGVELPWSA